MTELVANDPGLVLVAFAAAALAVVLRRTAPALRERRFRQARCDAASAFHEAMWRELGRVETETIELGGNPIDLTESVDLTTDVEAASHDAPADDAATRREP